MILMTFPDNSEEQDICMLLTVRELDQQLRRKELIMNVDEMFPSRYLRGSELNGAKTVTIARVVMEEAYRPGEGKSTIFVLYVDNGSKGVILSRALAMAISKILNESNTDRWTGKKCVLYPEPMNVAGREVVAIRARAAAQVKAES